MTMKNISLKLTIEILEKIDHLTRGSIYENRSAFIRDGMRRIILKHWNTIKEMPIEDKMPIEVINYFDSLYKKSQSLKSS
jgi:Arc/MetJ-type ribon-helix-helix transcriptional regulator